MFIYLFVLCISFLYSLADTCVIFDPFLSIYYCLRSSYWSVLLPLSCISFSYIFFFALYFSRPLGMCPSPLQVPSRPFKCPMVPLAPSSTFSTLKIVPFAPSNALWCPSTLQHTDPKAGWIGIRKYGTFFFFKFCNCSLIIRLVIST